MQIAAPLRVLLQVVGDAFGKKNVTGISAIHYSLGDVYSCAGDVGLLVQVSDFIDGAAMNTHAHAQSRIAFQRLANLQGAQHRRFRTVAKNERSSIACR